MSKPTSLSVVGQTASVPLQTFNQTLDEMFPIIDPGIEPFGHRVVIQIASPMKVTKGGVILTEDSQDTIKWNVQTARVIMLGPVAFKDRVTLKPWPEGDWAKPGAYVRCVKYGGDRWEIPYVDKSGVQSVALFAIVKDVELMGRVTVDPRFIKAYI